MIKKNLVVAIVGDESLHKNWIQGDREFDLFVIYYGDKENPYINDGVLYDKAKGSKFIILDQMEKKHHYFFKEYDAIIVPDDDLYITTKDLNEFFKIFHEYKMELAQPSVLGWQSLFIVAQNPEYILRYTSWVEIMTPCFSQKTFQKLKHTFTENNSNWGIDFLWTKILEYPEDSVGIVDEIVAIHTRPCFQGDTYWRNKNNNLFQDLDNISKKYNIDLKFVKTFNGIKRSFNYFDKYQPEDKFFPNSEIFTNLISQLRNQAKKKFI